MSITNFGPDSPVDTTLTSEPSEACPGVEPGQRAEEEYALEIEVDESVNTSCTYICVIDSETHGCDQYGSECNEIRI